MESLSAPARSAKAIPLVQQHEHTIDIVRDVEALLTAAIGSGGLDPLPADPADHAAHNHALRVIYCALDRAAACLAEADALDSRHPATER